MKQRRIRINLEDNEGAKFKFDIEGNVTKDKVLKLFELMDLMKGSIFLSCFAFVEPKIFAKIFIALTCQANSINL